MYIMLLLHLEYDYSFKSSSFLYKVRLILAYVIFIDRGRKCKEYNGP